MLHFYTVDSHSFHSDHEARPRINRRANEGGHSVWHRLQVSDPCGRSQSTGSTLLPMCRKRSQYQRGLNKCVLQNKLTGSMMPVLRAECHDDPLLCRRRKFLYWVSICDDAKESGGSVSCSVDADFDTLITAVCRSQEEFPAY